jgi:hypothetical protein
MSHEHCVASRQYRRLFQPHEDDLLRKLVEQFGTDDWIWIAVQMPNRTARQCRERYQTYLCPEVNISPWTDPEDKLLMEKFEELGSKWADYRPFFKNRTVNNIKNRWYTITRRKKLEAEYLAKTHNPPDTQPDDQQSEGGDPMAVFDIAHLLNRPVSS